MQFSFFQKIISFSLIFFLLFGFTIRVPFVAFFGSQTYAESEDFYNLVSIIVDEDIYDDIRSKLVRYTQDIQWVLENTRVVILPTPSTATAFDIASLNEKLYYEWYKWVRDVDFESKLVGTLLVGDIPVPVVFDESSSSRTILPYTDFEDKSYTYDHNSDTYQPNPDAAIEVTPEIWHGVISPHSWDPDTDVELIRDYLDKNHDFYRGQWNFSEDLGVINANAIDDVPAGYEPYVFYYDQFRESQALSYERYQWYQAYTQNIEDISYNRFTRELADKVKDQVLWVQNENLRDLVEKAIPGFDIGQAGDGPDVTNTPDIQTRFLINESTNKFLDIFNEGTLSDIRKYVYNAGRYNGQGSEVNVDMAPFLISLLDEVSAQIIKNTNNQLEDQIDTLVQSGLSRDLIIPTTRQIGSSGQVCRSTYTNFYYGQQGSDINSAADCSIYRGSLDSEWKLVEGNRGLNVDNVQDDLRLCTTDIRSDSNGVVTSGISGYWGGNTPINLDNNSFDSVFTELGDHNVQWGITPVFDIAGAREVSDSRLVPSPLNCLTPRYILTAESKLVRSWGPDGENTNCQSSYRVPISGQTAQNWSCSTVNRVWNFSDDFAFQYENIPNNSWGSCVLDVVKLWNDVLRSHSVAPNCRTVRTPGSGWPDGDPIGGGSRQVCSCPRPTSTYEYKKIPSYIEHKSPTNQEFGEQLQALTSQSLPVDVDRYIDFVAADGEYARVDYPHLFRVDVGSEADIDLESVDISLKSYLDNISTDINTLISERNPEKLSGIEKTLYDLTTTGSFPGADVDLYTSLSDRELQTLDLDGDQKEISYYDTLVFAVYWNSLKTASGKYKFIFENYLSDQFGDENQAFPLPRNKKSYEVTYIAAPGDSQNAYIKLDPESKANNPFAEIIARNIALSTTLLSSNVIGPEDRDGVFACAPPDGVPIWEWIPAVICWLQSNLPPTISIWEWACGPSLLTKEEQELLHVCQGDVNKNGINDCIEWKLTDGSLELESDSSKYHYNSVGTLWVSVRDKDDNLVAFDNISYVDFRLKRLEIPLDTDQEFGGNNIQVIYDEADTAKSSKQDYQAAQKYIRFRESRSRVSGGTALTYFSTKNSDFNAEFISDLRYSDNQDVESIFLESNTLPVQVRGDRLFLNSYSLSEQDDISPGISQREVSDLETLFLIDTNISRVEDLEQEILEINESPEKGILAITNYSKWGNVLSLEYPLTLRLSRDEEILYEQSGIVISDLDPYLALPPIEKSWKIEISVVDASGYQATKTIEYRPTVPSQLDVELGTTISETWGNLTTHILTILDRFENVVSGEVYNLDLEIDGDGLVFQETGDRDISTNTIEWYKIFRTLSTDETDQNTLNFQLRDPAGNTLVETSRSIDTLSDITIDIEPTTGPIVVGGGEYSFDIELQDGGGNLLTDFDSRAYLTLNPLYGSTSSSYVDIVDGKTTITLQTSTIAARDVKLEFQVEGIARIIEEYIDILPEEPIRIDLSLSRDQIEASSDDSTFVYATLRDRYDNEVFTDDSTELSLEVERSSSSIITINQDTKTVKDGKTQFQLQGTNIPWIGYFKVDSSPDISENSFEIIGQAPFIKNRLTIPTMTNDSGLTEQGEAFFKEYNNQTYITRFASRQWLLWDRAYAEMSPVLQERILEFWDETNSLQVNGVGENAGSIETFYFWNEDDIRGNSYNGIYSILLGAPYGDITQEKYLAWAVLFDRDNRSLAVSSTLSNPYAYHDILRIGSAGSIDQVLSGDITQDIELRPELDREGRISLDIFNAALGTHVWKLYYNFGNVWPEICSSDIDVCVWQESGVFIQSLDSQYTLEESSGDISLKNAFWTSLLELKQWGSIERHSNLYFEVNTDQLRDYLLLDVMSGDQTIAQIALSLRENPVDITRDQTLLTNKLSTLENTLIAHLKTNQYWSRDIFQKNGATQKVLFYNDPFGDPGRLDSFHESSDLGFENISEEKWLGWEEANKSLLLFAAGETIGEATRQYASFSLINLGDPVVSMKKIPENFINAPSIEKSFDSTLWKKISDTDNVLSYQVFDYNNDQRQDVILVKSDGYIELLENIDTASNFLEKWNLVYAVDGGPTRLVKVWDFTGDNYDDIFFVSQDGEPVIFNNHIKDFRRISLSEQFSLSGSIIQAEVFDMDNDLRSDIVTLDDAGQIHILYGWGDPQNPRFESLSVGDWYGIELSEATISRWGALYFDGLPQIDNSGDLSSLASENTAFADAINSANSNGVGVPAPEFFPEHLADRLLFIDLPYTPVWFDLEDLSDTEVFERAVDAGIDTSNYAEFDGFLRESGDSLKDFVQEYGSFVDFNNFSGQSTQTSFLRSEYASSQDISIEKKFTDLSPSVLQIGDKVAVEVRIKNTGNQIRNNVAFVDTIAKNFVLDSTEITVLSQDNKTLPVKQWPGIYDLLIDWFFLIPGEEIILEYTLETLPLRYGYIQVGLFEEGELGDDIYGDIILKPDHFNCGDEADIYTSVSERSYVEGITNPVCDENTQRLPDDLTRNTIDTNGNGVPDYIDDLVNNEDDRLEYAESILEEFHQDSDNDGIPDRDDRLPKTNDDDTDILWTINQINETVDEISEELDTVIEWLSCGFGGGSCIATPLNWAPLAPWGDPTLFGLPIGNGLRVDEGIPILSGLTGINIPNPSGCFQVPTVYPASPFAFRGTCTTSLGAGWSLWVNSPTNFFRLFATPTLTGGFGIAACFWAPASVVWNTPPPGVSPIAPGWNCVVAAVPLLWCQGEEGDPRVTGIPFQYPNYGIIHANCPSGTVDKKTLPPEIDEDFVEQYIDYKETGNKTQSLVDSFKTAFQEVAEWGGNWNIPSWPLVNIGWGGDVDLGLNVQFDASALGSWNFEDVIQVQNTRTAGFPSFLMDWVTRQLEEVVNKLTNLPKIFVILPDFSGIFDAGWEDYSSEFDQAFEKQQQVSDQNRQNIQTQIDGLRWQKRALSCSGQDRARCRILDLQISGLEQQKRVSQPETLSGIKAAYEFLGNIPLVQIESETISINVPWADASSLDRALTDWRFALDQWKSEIARAKSEWDISDGDLRDKFDSDAEGLLRSLERNIEILEEYKEFPEKLNELISIKEVWLEQILCNIEAISGLIGGWISSNGERFKAWVELFILIKSILKSWQLLIDVFQWYEEECHQCKNERQDLQNFIWTLIGGVIPQLPIIQFPKWPDIILDLHNVRAGMTVYLPDFQVNLRPIVLPTLPTLSLPDIPNASLSLPELPILPTFELPELPELPTLPSVELPDLPPPPQIPKLFGAVEGILNILKLVTRVMCIVKQSPFVPEWRVGDQIAFITERNGNIPTDFIDLTFPQFSYPVVDAIKVTTFVNFEFETEFILEAVRQITAPLDTFSSDIVSLFKIQVPDVDVAGAVIDDINVDVEIDGSVDVNGQDISSLRGNSKWFAFLSMLFAKKIQDLFVYVHDNKDTTVSNREFISFVQENLASPAVTSNPRLNEVRKLWEEVGNLTYSKENKLIQALLDNKNAKFDELQNIITTEMRFTKELREDLRDFGTPTNITQTSIFAESQVEAYNQRLSWYNEKLVKSAINLIEWWDDSYRETQISQVAGELKSEIRQGITSYSDSIQEPLYASHNGIPHSSSEVNSCSYGGSGSGYQYNYEGIYVLEFDRHYRLFEYLDELRGDEYTTPLDVDQDGDEDLLYMVAGEVFLKENLKNTDTKSYVNLPPLILTADNNSFYNGDVYYEAINGFQEANVSDSHINIQFQAPTDESRDNFRMEFYTIVDKFRHLGDQEYIPANTKKQIVDAFADIPKNTLIGSNQNYTLGKNLAYIKSAWVIPGAKLTTRKMLNIKDDLRENNLVTLTTNSELYAWRNNFTIEYYTTDPEVTERVTVEKHTHISFPELTSIIGLTGDAYVAGSIDEDIEGARILQHIGKPLLAWATLEYTGNDQNLTESSHIDIEYYDGSEVELHMSEVSHYRLYELGNNDTQHLIRLRVANDFYYAKIHTFRDNIPWTQSRQILLSPQKQADTQPPEIGLNQKIRIPVYQKKTIDLTPYIYEDSGIGNIRDVAIDFDFETDNDNDGDPRNDRDTQNINILQSPNSIKVEFWEYEELFSRQIRISLTDGNDNTGHKDIDFEVYPPAPQIQWYDESTIEGVIDETLQNEPVRIYRVRWWAIKKLENTEGSDVVETTGTGWYTFGIPDTTKWLLLERDDVEVASVDEDSWAISLLSPLARVQVLASNDTGNAEWFPRISIEYLGDEIFYQYIQPEVDPDISIIRSRDEITGEGIYVRILDQDAYNYFKVPLGVRFNPGAVVLYLRGDDQKNNVFSVFRDGRVYSEDTSRYTLKYQVLDDTTSYILHDSVTQTDIAEVILEIDGSYILR